MMETRDAPRASLRLVFQPGSPQEKVWELANGTLTLGRAADNDIVVPYSYLSRRHARLTVRGDEVRIEDLGSTNAITVSGSSVRRATLRSGQGFSVGDAVFAIESPEEVAAPVLLRDIDDDLTRRPIETMLIGPQEAASDTTPFAAGKVRDSARSRVELLLKASQILASPAPLDELLDRVVELVLQILDVHRAAILLIDSDSGEIAPRAARTEGEAPESESSLYSETIARYVMERSVAAVFTDAAAHTRFQNAPSVLLHSVRACMCAPLKAKDEVLGVLYVDNLTRPGTFTPDDLEFLSAFANQAAAAIHNALLHAELEREAVRRNNLQRFFPPTVVTSLMSGEMTPGDPVERNVTVVFADICDYTRISSSLRPGEVLELLNQYLPAVAGAVFAREGTLEKYIGDALLAVWGAPFEKPDDADRALQAAVDMQVAIARLAGQWAGGVGVAIRVGLCSGPVAAGNIGTGDYLQYATIGDTTNLASRVCAAAEPGEILIAESTRGELSPGVWTLEALAPVEVKGKDEPVRLHRVLWRAEQ